MSVRWPRRSGASIACTVVGLALALPLAQAPAQAAPASATAPTTAPTTAPATAAAVQAQDVARAPGMFTPLSPTRLLDTRESAAVPGGGSVTFAVAAGPAYRTPSAPPCST